MFWSYINRISYAYCASTTIFSKNLLAVLSLGFKVAFDRVGAHTVLQELKKWDIGKKTYNFNKAFQSNRKFAVCVNKHSSNTYPLHNGIPHGSPLTTLFINLIFTKSNKNVFLIIMYPWSKLLPRIKSFLKWTLYHMCISVHVLVIWMKLRERIFLIAVHLSA